MVVTVCGKTKKTAAIYDEPNDQEQLSSVYSIIFLQPLQKSITSLKRAQLSRQSQWKDPPRLKTPLERNNLKSPLALLLRHILLVPLWFPGTA